MSERSFSLLGDQIIWNEATDRYNSLRAEFLEMSREAEKAVEDVFCKKIQYISALRYEGASILAKTYEDYLQRAVWKLIEFGIYDIDEEELLKLHEGAKELEYKGALQSLINRLNAIDNSVAESKAQSRELVDSMLRGTGEIAGDGADSVVDGLVFENGYEVGGGMTLLAGAAAGLVATGGVALYQKVKNDSLQKDAEEEKLAIFQNKESRQVIFTSFAQDVFMLYTTLGVIINERLEEDEYYYFPLESDLAAIEPICRNIFRGNFNHIPDKPDLEREQIYNVLQVNPYDSRIFSYILVKQGQINTELKTIFRYLNIDMSMLADSYLREKYTLSDYDTYEEMVDFEKIVASELEVFEAATCKFMMETIIKKQQLFDIRRTFNGYMYDTIEIRDDAEKQYMEFFAEDENVMEMSLDELVAKYYVTLPQEIYTKNREDLQQIILAQISTHLEELQTSEAVEEYLADAEEKREKYGFEELSLCGLLGKYKKKLERKEKMNATVAAAKEKAGAAANMAKEKSKELLSKVPFGKKKEGDDFEEGSDLESENPEESKTGENKKLGLGMMKNTFGAISAKKDALLAGKGESAPAKEEPVVETKACPQCGNALKAAAKFCGKCGYRF